jgi:hypothetical protein
MYKIQKTASVTATTVSLMDLDQGNTMIILGSISMTFEASLIFLGSWGSINKSLTIKPLLAN